MAEIKLTKYDFPNRNRGRGQSTLKLKSNPVVGYVPLLKLFEIITGGNDFFRVEHGLNLVDKARDRVHFDQGYSSISFARNMRNYPREDSNPMSTIVSTLLSTIGIRGKQEYLPSKLATRRGDRMDYDTTRKGQKILVTNPVDIFILAIMKPSDIVKININHHNIVLESDLITLFISEEKYYNKDYLDQNYNKTVAKYLRESVNSFIAKYSMKVEIVPDEVLRQYYSNLYSVESNSIFEIMEIDKDVKDAVFSTINERLELAE